MKKTLLILLNVVLVALIGVSSFYLYHVLQNREITNFIKNKEAEDNRKENQDIQIGNIGYYHITAYFPKDSEGNRIAAVENLINQKVKKDFGQAKALGNIHELIFISSSDSSTNIPNVRKTEVSTDAYKVSGLKISHLKKGTPQSILLNASNQRFSLADLFTNLDKARHVLSEHFKNELKAKGISDDQIAQYVLAFETVDLQSLDFTYEAGRVILHLPGGELGMTDSSVEIAHLFDFVNTQYLMESDIQAYEAYQAEKARQAAQNMVALTFDDGPNPKTTPQVLDTLKKYHAKATFFILGQNIAGNEELIKRMVAEGHQVANHSWSHPNFVNLSPEQVKHEVEQTQSALEQITGHRPLMVRPPYGSVNKTVMAAMGLPAMYWSVDSLDWKSRNATAILGVIKANTRPGSIILMHDIHQPTADSLESVLQYLQEKGMSTGTLSDMLGTNLNPQMIYYDRDTARPAQ